MLWSVKPHLIYTTEFYFIEMERPGKKNQREDDNEITVSTLLRNTILKSVSLKIMDLQIILLEVGVCWIKARFSKNDFFVMTVFLIVSFQSVKLQKYLWVLYESAWVFIYGI